MTEGTETEETGTDSTETEGTETEGTEPEGTVTEDPDGNVDGEHFVYVLRCADDSLYTGYTTDVQRRVAEHDCGDGAKYTRGRTPVELVHVEGFDSQSAAMAREYEVKQLDRREKESLIRESRAVFD